MVRGDLGGDGDAARLREADGLDGAAGAEMGDVDVGSGSLGEGDVAGDGGLFGRGGGAAEAEARTDPAFVHDAVFRERAVLAVVNDGQREGAGVLERAAHEGGIPDGGAVITEGNAAGGSEVAELGELFAGAAPGNGADGQDADNGAGGRLAQDVFDDGARVHGGFGVGHGADGGEAAAGGGAGAGGDVLLVLEAGVAEMGVEVDKAGGDDEAAGIDLARTAGGERVADGGDSAILDEDVGDGVVARCGVDEAAVADDDAVGHRGCLCVRAARGGCDPGWRWVWAAITGHLASMRGRAGRGCG